MQQNLDQNTSSRTLGTLGAGVPSGRCTVDMHSPVPRPHITRCGGSESSERHGGRRMNQEVTHCNKKNSSLTVNHMMSGFVLSANIQTLTLGATVTDGGDFLQRDFSLRLFGQRPPGQVQQLGEQMKKLQSSLLFHLLPSSLRMDK